MENRKKDHISMAFESQIGITDLDPRFFYEPMLSPHPENAVPETVFAGKTMRLPIWISSMTGGTKEAGKINRNLALACNEFGLGMGLGSCRILLDDEKHFPDFDLRDTIGENQPFWANLGINQVELLLRKGKTDLIVSMVEKLRTDGLFVHVNPFQEWLQPEGDRLMRPAMESVQELLELVSFPIIVKEVGQGMGFESLRQLLRLPLAAIEFAAFGGTNFAKMELMRSNPQQSELYGVLANIGHTAEQMTDMVNRIVESEPQTIRCKQLIISGGIKSFLDGYHLIQTSKLPAVYGQASAFLKHAAIDYPSLKQFVEYQAKGLQMAYAFLRVK
ncbi:MAG TPA: type 2 isopentenyl-diphosphate Delta-isomerase [Bacteroidales bacterium]|nr:type 2 isopentenyl-diphosphate Delta-isomerase [Bacteroidales bacterium]